MQHPPRLLIHHLVLGQMLALQHGQPVGQFRAGFQVDQALARLVRRRRDNA